VKSEAGWTGDNGSGNWFVENDWVEFWAFLVSFPLLFLFFSFFFIP
jgi:hypothetical protein